MSEDSRLVTDFRLALRNQSEHEKKRGRAAIVDLSDPFSHDTITITPFSCPQSLCDARDDSKRQLVILEDLGEEWIEMLVPKLDIPLYFFALHWADPNDHVLGKVRIPLGQPPDQHFILSYRELLPVELQDNKREVKYRLNCSALRPIARRIQPQRLNERSGGVNTCEQLISYWAIPRRNTGTSATWTAILLVDPKPNNPNDAIIGKHADDPTDIWSPVACRPKDCPPRPMLSQQPFTGSPWSVMSTPSIFDELTTSARFYVRSNYPSGATHPCRRLLLAKTCATVDFALEDTIALTAEASQGIKDITKINFSNFEKSAWKDEWAGEFFTYLWELREDLELMRHRLERNIGVLERLKRLDSSRPSNAIDKKSILAQVEDDLEEWKQLQHTEKYAFQILERTMASYSQAVQATDVAFANAQALSSRKLTGLATLFVPGSLCAAVLAMLSFSSASDEKFRIFWVVTIPLALIIWTFLLTSVPKLVKNHWTNWRPRPDPKTGEEHVLEKIRAADIESNEREKALFT